MSEPQGIVMTEGFQEGFKKFQNATGKDLPTFGREVMRVLVETCYHWTPPPTKGNRGMRGGRKGGKAAVQDDIYAIAEGRQPAYLDFLMKIYGSEVPFAKFTKGETGEEYRLHQVKIDRRGSNLSAYHYSRRNHRGRTPKNRQRDGSDVTNKVLTPYSKLTKYIRQEQKRVGKLKGAWVRPLIELRSKLPPAWVRNARGLPGQSGPPSGTLSEDTKQKNIFVANYTATAKAEYMREFDGFMRRAHTYVEKTILGRRLDSWVESMIKRHGTP